MRKIAFALFLAGAAAATPALAERPHWQNGGQRVRSEQSSRDDSRQARPQVQRSEGWQRAQSNGDGARAGFQRPQFSSEGQRVRPLGNVAGGNADAPDSVRNWQPREQRFRQQGGFAQQQQVQQQYRQDQFRQQQVREQAVGGNWTQRRYGGQRVVTNGMHSPFRAQADRSTRVQWNTGWRNDRRYDWRERRRRNGSLFHLGLYIDPFGWGYQPYSIGYQLYPNYYQQNYWIDAGLYGLPYPPPGTQWVRYWNDALLVDMFTGQVVDSIPGFFW